MSAVRIAALSLAALAVACATAQRGRPDPCEATAERVDTILRDGLDGYLAQMRALAAAREPGASTAKAEARARERADTWSAARLGETAAACRGWTDAMRRCVEAAGDAPALNACGLEPLVTSFTDEVVAGFAANPLSDE
jgi:hypothetical protein